MLSASEVLDKHARLTDQLVNDRAYHEYLDGFMYDTWKKAHDAGGWGGVRQRFGSLFHPANNPAQFRALLHKDLFDARTFQVTGQMVDAVTGTMENSRKSVLSIEEAGLPYPTGFVWLDKPVRIPDRHGREVARRAVSWGPQLVTYEDPSVDPRPGRPRPAPGKTHTVPGVRITSWSYVGDRDFYWTDRVAADHHKQSAHMELVFLHSNVIPFGFRVQATQGADLEFREDFVVWVRTLWAFMDTEIVTTAKAPVPRPFLRRAQRTLGRPDINVVSLRHVVVPHDPGHEPGHREVDWSCTWVVSGHHRHLEAYDLETYRKHHATPDPGDANRTCAVCGGRITWVHAYVKGPTGMPLRSVEQLYRLER